MVSFPTQGREPLYPWLGGWVSGSADQGAKTCPNQESNPGRLDCSVLTTDGYPYFRYMQETVYMPPKFGAQIHLHFTDWLIFFRRGGGIHVVLGFVRQSCSRISVLSVIY